MIKTESKDLLLLGALAVVGYLVYKNISKSSASGLGLGGRGRAGMPKTEAERVATHLSRYGTTQLPPRGTGLLRR